jgi:hypothetical protein
MTKTGRTKASQKPQPAKEFILVAKYPLRLKESPSTTYHAGEQVSGLSPQREKELLEKGFIERVEK